MYIFAFFHDAKFGSMCNNYCPDKKRQIKCYTLKSITNGSWDALAEMGFSTGSVAERSKALVLGTSHFDAVGSNPTAAIILFKNQYEQILFLINLFNIINSIFIQFTFYNIYCVDEPNKVDKSIP